MVEQLIGDAGHAWAREAQRGLFVYASATGFTERLREWAATEPRNKLITLDDMFA